MTPQVVVVAGGCLVACYTDIREGMIYNWLTFTLVGLGLLMNSAVGLFALSAWGLLSAFAVHYGLWRVGVQRGGDAKLMMGIGALLGTEFAMEATLWYGALYLPVGLLFLLARGKLKNIAAPAKQIYAKVSGTKDDTEYVPTMMKTAPVIALAATVSFVTPWIDRILQIAVYGEALP